MTTFRKTNQGEWVVFGTLDEVTIGKVFVTKKDGKKAPVDVERVGKPFTVDGRQMVYGYIAPKGAAAKAAPPPPPPAPPPAPEPTFLDAEVAWEIEAERKINTEDSDFLFLDEGPERGLSAFKGLNGVEVVCSTKPRSFELPTTQRSSGPGSRRTSNRRHTFSSSGMPIIGTSHATGPARPDLF